MAPQIKPQKGASVVQASITLEQESDCCSDDDGGSEITIQTHDGGGGVYLTIETKRWALDPDDFEPFVESMRQLLKTVEVKKDSK